MRQLLRLRVLFLSITVATGDNVFGHRNASQEAFLNSIDHYLFEYIGRDVLQSTFVDAITSAVLHRVGCEIVLMASVKTNLPRCYSWCLWVDEQTRIFLDLEKFKCSLEFPKNGALCVKDNSYGDPM